MTAFEIIDTALLALMNDWRHPGLTATMSVITWLGSILILLPLALAFGWHAGRKHGWRRWAFLPAAVCGSAILAQALKWVIDRDRPGIFPSLIPMPADASFPSAHTLQITAFVAAWLASTGSLRRFDQVIAGIFLVLVTGFSRLYLQVHFPSDVLFGILGGLVYVWMLQRLPIWRIA